ncbi:hypothetical protein GCM10009612_21490 [Streptomyces beijiangensis]
MKSFTRIATSAVAIVGLGATGILLAPPASADVSPQAASCKVWKNSAGTIGYAKCSGVRSVRVEVTCISYTGASHIEYGSWVDSKYTSYHKCAGADAGQAGVLKVIAQARF